MPSARGPAPMAYLAAQKNEFLAPRSKLKTVCPYLGELGRAQAVRAATRRLGLAGWDVM